MAASVHLPLDERATALAEGENGRRDAALVEAQAR